MLYNILMMHPIRACQRTKLFKGNMQLAAYARQVALGRQTTPIVGPLLSQSQPQLGPALVVTASRNIVNQLLASFAIYPNAFVPRTHARESRNTLCSALTNPSAICVLADLGGFH